MLGLYGATALTCKCFQLLIPKEEILSNTQRIETIETATRSFGNARVHYVFDDHRAQSNKQAWYDEETDRIFGYSQATNQAVSVPAEGRSKEYISIALGCYPEAMTRDDNFLFFA